MRTFADPSFFRLIHALLDEARVNLRRTRWTHCGVSWQRQRHSFTGSETGFAIDQYLIVKPGPNGWTLLVVKEMWWDGGDKSIRSTQWGKPLSGSRVKILEWLRAEERRINGQVLPTKAAE